MIFVIITDLNTGEILEAVASTEDDLRLQLQRIGIKQIEKMIWRRDLDGFWIQFGKYRIEKKYQPGRLLKDNGWPSVVHAVKGVSTTRLF